MAGVAQQKNRGETCILMDAVCLFNGHLCTILISIYKDWLSPEMSERSQCLVAEVLREVCYQLGLHCLKEVRGKS